MNRSASWNKEHEGDGSISNRLSKIFKGPSGGMINIIPGLDDDDPRNLARLKKQALNDGSMS